MNEKIISLFKTAELNTRLLLNCFANVDEATAGKRISNKTNSMIFLLIHLIDAKYHFINLLDAGVKSPYYDLTKDIESIDGFENYPPLEEMLKVWEDSNELFINKLSEATEEKFDKITEARFPIGDDTVFGAVTFCLQHESHHIGQLSLLRKHFGFPAMSYK
jgi:uncharacterized damage-inducible protein DinB